MVIVEMMSRPKWWYLRGVERERAIRFERARVALAVGVAVAVTGTTLRPRTWTETETARAKGTNVGTLRRPLHVAVNQRSRVPISARMATTASVN